MARQLADDEACGAGAPRIPGAHAAEGIPRWNIHSTQPSGRILSGGSSGDGAPASPANQKHSRCAPEPAWGGFLCIPWVTEIYHRAPSAGALLHA